MRVIIIFASLIAVTTAIVTGYTRSAVGFCYDDGTNYQLEFTVFPNSDTADVNYVAGFNLTGEGFDPTLFDECGSNQTSFFTVNATGQNEFTIVVNVDKDTLVADKPCGHTNDGLDFLWSFRTAKVEFVTLPSSDIWFRVPCNFSEATLTQVSALVTITGSPGGSATDGSHAFKLELVDASDTPVTVVNLGDPVRLQMTETNGDQTGVTGYSCVAGNNAAFDKQLILIDNLGCPDTTFLATGFVDAGLLFVAARTPQFIQFHFTGSNTIHYKCKVHYCVDVVKPLCDDLCGSGGPTGRKRREAEDALDEEIIEVSTKITIVSVPVSYEPGPTGVEDKNLPKEVPSCLSNIGIIAAFASLGVLLLITIAAAVFVCIRSMRLAQGLKGQSGWSDKQKL